MLNDPGRGSFLAALLIAVVLSFAPIVSHGLWSPDEPTGAGIGRAMADSGDWIVPRLNGQPFLEKPPLYWWTLAAGLRIFGISDVAARAPSALIAVLTLLAVWAAGRRLGGARQGLLATCVLATTMLFLQNATRVTVDPALMLFVALVHLGFMLLAEAGSPAEARWARGLIVVALPLAFLCKGIVAVGLGAGPPVIYLLATRRGRAIRELLGLAAIGLPVFALLVVPWAVALQRAAGWSGLQECLVNNTVGRFVHTEASARYGHTQPVWFYLAIVIPWLLPWTLALPAMVRSVALRRGTPGSDGRRLLLVTAGLGLLLLSVPGSKREVYLLPLLPAFAIGVAGWLDGVGTPGAVETRDRRALLAMGGFAAFLVLLLGAGTAGLAWSPRIPAAAAPVRSTVSTAFLGGFALCALALGLWIVMGLARRWRTAPTAGWVVAVWLVVTLGLGTAAEALFDPIKRPDELMRAIAARFPGREPVPAYLPPVVSNEAIFGIIEFKLGRLTHPLSSPEDVQAWLAAHPGAPILIRMEQLKRLPPDLRQELVFVYDETGRKSAPFGIAVEKARAGGAAPLMQNLR